MGAGDLKGMFDGPTSPGLDLSGQLVVFNLREVKDEARPILMACTAAWLQGRGRATLRCGGSSCSTRPGVVLRHLAIARWLRESWKLARQYGVQNIAVMHRLSDLTAAGDSVAPSRCISQGAAGGLRDPGHLQAVAGRGERARELLGRPDRGRADPDAGARRGPVAGGAALVHRSAPHRPDAGEGDRRHRRQHGRRSAPWATDEADEAVDSAS